MPNLQTALLDLLNELTGTGINMIIGGGYGIFLKIQHAQTSGARTLLKEWPEPRSTNDLDLFLRPELLIEAEKLKPLAEAIAKLGYQVVPGAEKYQFVLPGPENSEVGSVKIDILTGPQSRFTETSVRADSRRARPHPSVGIHAHPVDEALTLENGLVTVQLAGKTGSGADLQTEVLIPHPYTFAMMKLFAFRDRFEDPDKEYGRYHALDIYTILATTTEQEWETALQLRDSQIDQPIAKEAGRLVFEYFSERNRMGLIRLRESPYYRDELQLEGFISSLKELFSL